jgi:protein phosphatase PTC6
MHFGISSSRGTRLYNEDAYQAGVIEVPAFAQRPPSGLPAAASSDQGDEPAGNENSDPQCFYFGVFDGHGGSECSRFLRNNLHLYIEDAAKQLELLSSLKRKDVITYDSAAHDPSPTTETKSAPQGVYHQQPEGESSSASEAAFHERDLKAQGLQRKIVSSWGDLVGGYFKRFSPEHFHLMRDRLDKASGGHGEHLDSISVEAVLTYAFLKADFDFVAEQTERLDQDIVRSDRALNEHDILGEASRQAHGGLGAPQVLGGSTCSIVLISTPTLAPFWLPAARATLVTAHVGDTRILLCSTATGRAMPLTTNHHPSASGEGWRLRRYAASVECDSFGEERMGGLANTRAFGDVQSKRLGVSAEPEIRRLELRPAEFSFLVLVSDGVSGLLTDQEIVDVIKESSTPDEGARDLVNFATEVSREGDNATCMVIRLGGWERRMEGGYGAQGTKEARDWRRQEAIDPRHHRQ